MSELTLLDLQSLAKNYDRPNIRIAAGRLLVERSTPPQLIQIAEDESYPLKVREYAIDVLVERKGHATFSYVLLRGLAKNPKLPRSKRACFRKNTRKLISELYASGNYVCLAEIVQDPKTSKNDRISAIRRIADLLSGGSNTPPLCGDWI